jgi:hypothetical protein
MVVPVSERLSSIGGKVPSANARAARNRAQGWRAQNKEHPRHF